MHKIVKNLIDLKNQVKLSLGESNNAKLPKIIAVSKTFNIDKILPLLEHGHLHYGENKVQEAVDKWTAIKKEKPLIQIHMIGKLQTNKVKAAVKLFDYIHSVDSRKLAKKISDEQIKVNKKIKVFIQVNIGNENQKTGVNKNEIDNLVTYCYDINLHLVGFMCIPPACDDPIIYFNEMRQLSKKYSLPELSMGMSSDYLKAADNLSTYLRIGSSIFGKRN